MQQQPYGGYPYYPQPVYPHTPYMGGGPPPGPSGGYPPFYGPPNPQPPAPAPRNPNPPAPTPYSFDAAAYPTVRPATQHETGPQLRRHRRTLTIPTPAPTPATTTAPLKSAMKKTMTVFNAFGSGDNPLTRQSSNSQHGHSISKSRPRVYSNPQKPQNLVEDPPEPDTPFHMMVSFHGYNEVRVEPALQYALEDLRKYIWPLWPDGIESDELVGHTSITKFRNAPWDLGGNNVRHAYKFIVEFFRLFQQRGYSYQTAMNIATPTPRLIFQMTKPDQAEFFLGFLSQDGRRITLIHPPNHIDIYIGARLRTALPKRVLSDDVVDEYMRVIELKRRPNTTTSTDVDVPLVFVEALKIISDLGFHLDATIPLSRRNSLGMRSSRELLVFKSIAKVSK
ncbi:unnamed protein product [Cyclocybe aegerita]|uniref:Uncharacterized protein n=1 Tax=Cyclocybe aegerita TaxID=1973307 RepID=A0A8S0VX39_CYCAE|nr:unnamed protein product [Cyclocybe aegerita]